VAKKKQKLDKAIFSRLMGYFMPFKWWIAVAMICALLVAASSAGALYLIKPAMDKIFSGEPMGSLSSLVWENDKLQNFLGDPPPEFLEKKPEKLTPEQLAVKIQDQWEERIQYLMIVPLLMIGLFFTKGIFRFLQNYILRIIGEKVIRQLRSQLYNHYQWLSIDYYTEANTGVMMSRITNDVNMMQRAVPSLVSLFREPMTMLFLTALAFSQIWYLALIILVIFPLTALPIVTFGRKIRKFTRRGQEHMGDLNSVLQENFSGIRVIKAFGMEDYESARFERENEALYQTVRSRLVYDELSSPTVEAIGAVAGAIVIYFGGWLVLKTNAVGGHYLEYFGGVTLSLTSGQFFTFIGSLLAMYEPLKKINKMNLNFQAANAAGARVFDVLDQVPSVVEQPDAIQLPIIKKNVQFENMRFRYEDDWVLDGIDFTAHAGQTVALVGSSGSGKTTLVNLIPRFYDASEGAVKIDGVNLRDTTLSSLRSQIGMVTQETFLFADSVAGNIAYGHNDTGSDRIIEVAKAAFAHEFIEELPNGYSTMIGELGVKLSGGQRQRLAIARALYKNAPILILDEATSALDTESERKVQGALENLMRGRTTFVIAHRLSTVRNADRILVLKKGRIIEDGTHEQLLEAKGEYARLYEIQFSEKK
jgi:subfamily B ATP-binding cassette protein MsbA